MGTRNRFNVCHPCCTAVPPPCVHCTDYPGDTVAVTFSGFGDAAFCLCGTWFNATFILQRSLYDPCFWLASGYWGCKSSYSYSYGERYTIRLGISQHFTGVKVWTCELYIGGWLFGYQWLAGAPGAIDCTATQTLAFAYYMNWTSIVYCSGYLTSSCQVN